MSLKSLLRKVGKSKITRGLGKAIDFGSDFLPPGFRDVGNLGGKLLQGKNLKTAAIGTAGDYLGGRLAKGLSGKLKGIGGGKLRGLLGSGAASGISIPNPDISALGGAAATIGANADRALGASGAARGLDWGGILKSGLGAITGTGGADTGQDWKSRLLGGVSDFVAGKKKGIGLGDIAKYALPALGAYQASKSAAKADKYRQKGLAGVEAEYAAARPLREMGLAGMIDPRMADVSSLFNRPRPQYRRIG